MIRFEKIDTKHWKMYNGEDELTELNLISSSITNKYHLITNFIEDVSKLCGDTFDEWLVELMIQYKNNEQERFKILTNNYRQLITFVDNYLDMKDIDFNNFVDYTKAKKSSILFHPVEIECIVKLSSYLKIYSLFSNNSDFKLLKHLHKKVYNKLAKEVTKGEIISKLFSLIQSKTYRYNLTDKYMWDYLNTIKCKTIDLHVIEIFNFVMNSILVLCEVDKNPISYFVGVTDESVKWFLRSVYKGSIVYDDSVSVEDIQSINVNNLKTFTFNDTIAHLKDIAFDYAYNKLEKEEILTIDNKETDVIIEFQNRISGIQFISPVYECITFPILAKATGIPYKHFKIISPEHASVLSVFVKHLLDKVFKGEYKNLFGLLDYYATAQPVITTTYKVKNVELFINERQDVGNFLGFNAKIILYEILCHFIGRISRISLCNTLYGIKIAGIPQRKVELDGIKFFTKFFSGELDDDLEKFKVLMDKCF